MHRMLLLVTLVVGGIGNPATADEYLLRVDFVTVEGPPDKVEKTVPTVVSLEVRVLLGMDFEERKETDGGSLIVSGMMEAREDGTFGLSPLRVAYERKPPHIVDATGERLSNATSATVGLTLQTGETLPMGGMAVASTDFLKNKTRRTILSYDSMFVSLDRPPADEQERRAQFQRIQQFRETEWKRELSEYCAERFRQEQAQAADEQSDEGLPRPSRGRFADRVSETGRRWLRFLTSRFRD